jgi:hypothetical protein
MLVVSGASGSPIGDPWSVDPGKMTMLKKPGDISIIDDEKVRLVLFTNFEYNLVNPSIILQNLKRFERLSREGKKKIIITSSVTPGEFIKSLERIDCTPGKMAASNDSNKKQAGDALEEEGKLKCAEIMSRWNYFFGNFVILQLNKLHYLHFGKNILETNHNGKECPGSACGLFEDDAWLGKNKRKAENPMEDYEVINQQKLFSQRYLSVWKSLTHEEQFLLIDLAEDGLVNTVNYMVLEELVERGLIYRDDGVLHIVNASFRNFILTAFSSGDIKTIQADITGGSSWNDYKYPVLIVLGSLVYFVLTSNPEKFGNVLPYITGITAGIPTIIKVLSYIKPSAGKT